MESRLTCRHCGRPIAVPGSTCPWCNKTIMVICSACKQYTDDEQAICQHCGQPLVPDTLNEVRAVSGLDPELAQLVSDRERAKLVPSGVIARYVPGFFYDDGQRRTVLVDLFGAPPNPRRETAVLLFAAIAYLVQGGYCGLRPPPDEGEIYWDEGQRWDGQVISLEGRLVQHGGMGMTVRQVIDRVIADEMDFGFEVVQPPRIRTPGMPDVPRVRDLSKRSATTAVVDLARKTELPEHQESEACRQTYQQIFEFVRADPQRAHYLAEVIDDVLGWFERYQEDPMIAMAREDDLGSPFRT
ncbi:MAG: zinc ribbon domain-containing protein [Anaerolineae bacterium]|nr:zinc ribbon domain-containing protein [Anaerolineae bacterium]